MGGGIENDLRFVLSKRMLHRSSAGDIDPRAIPTHNRVSAQGQFPDQLHAELTGGPKDHRFSFHQNTTG